jgi:hypothetical protein
MCRSCAYNGADQFKIVCDSFIASKPVQVGLETLGFEGEVVWAMKPAGT